MARRKLGFGSEAIGEWHIDITTKDLARLQSAFDHVTPRTGEMEKLHAAVWPKVDNFKPGLYSDFPDANGPPEARRTPRLDKAHSRVDQMMMA